MSVTIQLRRDTAANWTSVNPVLNQGELGLETDTSKIKIGDDSTAWTSLAYWSADSLPLPSGTPSEGQVPVATGSGNASAWGSSGAVSSVFGRTGAVVAESGDYTVFEVTGAGPRSVTAIVSPIGIAAGASLPNNGADYGPDTAGTTTSGLQEALTALEATGGKIILRQGAFQINSPMTYTSDYSLTIEGETRGRAENVTSSTNAWGVFLMVNSLSSGTVALTINSNTSNLGMLRLSNFTVRGQALGYTGSTASGVKFLATGTNGPAQIEIDNVACEFLGVPCINIGNTTNGPVIIGWIGFFYCGGSSPYTIPQLQMTTGTCHIGHIESYEGLNPAVGVTGSGSFCFVDIDSIWSGVNNVFNWGVGAGAPTNTYLHIGSVGAHNPGNSALILLDASSGSLVAHIGTVSWDNGSSEGKIIAGTSESTTGTVQVTIENLNGNPEYLIWNNYSASVGTGSFLDILSAYFTATPTADIPYANMAESVRTAASSWSELDGVTVSGTPSAGQVLTATSPTAADWQTPSGGGGTVSGQFLCTPTSYAPATRTTLSVTGSTMAALSSANVNTGNFTAPASGSVLVTVSLVAQTNTANSQLAFALALHGTSTLVASNVMFDDNGTNIGRMYSLSFLVTGLTSGDSYNFDLMGCTATSDILYVYAQGVSSNTPTFGSGNQAPVTMTVQAV